MKIYFKKLRITDIMLKVSKQVNFVDGINLITSKSNSPGKSVIMRSLYHCLGANCAFDDNFPKNNVLFELDFVANSHTYHISRLKNSFTIIRDEKLIDFVNYGEIYKLSNFFNEEFNMYVYLKSKNGSSEKAPPAFLFVPYYLDQDRSWKKEQEAFENMGQYEKMSRNDLYYFHLGVYTDEYNELKSQLQNVKHEGKEYNLRLLQLNELYMNIKDQLNILPVIVNTEEMEVAYKNNTEILNKDFSNQNKYQQELYNLENQKSSLIIKTRQLEKVIENINKGLGKQPKKTVICPNCLSEFDVDLKKEMETIYNKIYLQNQIDSFEKQIGTIEENVNVCKNQINRLMLLVSEKEQKFRKEKMNYEKYVERLSLSNMLSQKTKEIGSVQVDINISNSKIEELSNKLAEMSESSQKVKRYFINNYISKLKELNVTKFNSEDISPFRKLKLSGSQYVRSTLALFFSFLSTKKQMNFDNFMWPLVIDSPREGEQDNENSELILEFIFMQSVPGYQLIVASVNATDFIQVNKYPGLNVIELHNEQSQIMNEEGYERNKSSIELSMSYFNLQAIF